MSGLPLCAEVTPMASHYSFDVWQTEDGLPEHSVTAIVQTRDGYLWFGTYNGLVRFDGNRFTYFNEFNTPGLNSDRIVYPFEDSRTNLWVGTDGSGVVLVKDGKVENFSIGRGGHEGRLVSACEDSVGGVWFYTADARKSALSKVEVTADLARFADRDLVTEAVFEDLTIKQGVWAELDKICKPSCIFAGSVESP